MERGQTTRTLEGQAHSVTAVAVTPDGRRAVSASHDQTLRLWDLESGQTIRTFEGHKDKVRAVAVTPDGRCAVSASEDKTLRLWDLESRAEPLIFTADSPVYSCTFDRNGRTIVGGDLSGQVHLLRLVEADPIKPQIGETKIQLLQRKQPGTEF